MGMRASDAAFKVPEYWGTATPATMHFWFPVDEPHRWFGEIHIAGFVPEKPTTMSPLNGRGPRLFRGDNRDFTAAGSFINPNSNRFFTNINFSSGIGFVQVNPTCRAEGAWLPGSECSSARPIVLGEYDGKNLLDPKYDKNYFSMQRGGDTYRLKWSVVQSDQGFGQDVLRPRADGKLDFTAARGGSGLETVWSGDCFPSIEVMRVSGGTTDVIGRVSDAGAEAMFGGVTNVYNFFGVC